MAETVVDPVEEKKDDILEQLGLHPSQLAVQDHLLSLARQQPDNYVMAPQQQSDQPQVVRPPLAPAGSDAGTIPVKPLPRAEAQPENHFPDTPDSMAMSPADTALNQGGAKLLPRNNSMWSNGEQSISKRHPFWGGVLKGLDVAGTALVPNVMKVIPGTMLNQRVQDARANNTLSEAAELRQKNALATQEEAKADALKHPLPRAPKVNYDQGIPVSITRGENEYVIGGKDMPPDLQPTADAAIAAHKQRLQEQQEIQDNKPDTSQQDKQRGRELEGKLANGSISDDERKELTTRQQEAKLQGVSAEAEAQVGKPPVPAQYPKGASDPAYKTANAAWGKAIQKIKMEETAAGAATRNQGYEDTPYNVINTKTREIQVMTRGELAAANKKDPGTWIMAGQGGLPSMAKEANAENIRTSMENVKAASAVLDKGFRHRALVAGALADPSTTAVEFAQSTIAGQLDPDEQDFVIAVKNAREQIQGLRSMLQASGNSDARIRAIVATLPGASTPSSKYAAKQIDTAIADIDREMKGIPKFKGSNDRKPDNKKDNSAPPHPVNTNPHSDIGFVPSS